MKPIVGLSVPHHSENMTVQPLSLRETLYILELQEGILNKTTYPTIKPIIFHATSTLGLTISAEDLPLI